MSEQELELPKGWVETTLEHILETLEAGKRPKGGVKQSTEGIPSLGGEHLNDHGGFKFEKIKFIPLEFFETECRNILASLKSPNVLPPSSTNDAL